MSALGTFDRFADAHVAPTDCPPETTVTEPVLVPEVEYDFATLCVVPESPSLPVHE